MIDFSKETKLPRSAVFFLIIKNIKRLFKQLWAIAAIFFFQGLNDANLLTLFYRLLLIIGVVLGLALVEGFFQYFSFSYLIMDDKLIVKEGIIRKRIKSIPVNRIQNISVQQSFWQQILEMTTLSVDSAGSSGNEMEIYLDIDTSNALKSYLESYRAVNNANVATKGETKEETTSKNESRRLLTYFYDTKKLLLAAISRNHLKGFILLGGSILALASQLDGEILEKVIDQLWLFIFPYISTIHSVTTWIFMILAILLLVVIFNVVKTIFKYYKLKVTLRDDNIQFQSGLVNRMEQIIHLDKIQIIKKSINPIEKWLGVSTLTLLQFLIANKNDQSEKLTFSLPGFYASDELVNHIYADLKNDESHHFSSTNRYFIRNLYRILLIPFIFLSLVLFADLKLFFVPLIWLPFGILLSLLKYKKSKAEVGKNYVTIHSGMISNISQTIKISKIQGVTIKQSVFQEKRGLGSLIISTRWKSLTIPFVNIETIREINDYLLYKLESEEVNHQTATIFPRLT